MMEKLIQSRGDGSKKQKAVGSRPADDAVATSARHMHTHTLTQAYTRTLVRAHTHTKLPVSRAWAGGDVSKFYKPGSLLTPRLLLSSGQLEG